MSSRRDERVFALQALYQLDLKEQGDTVEEAVLKQQTMLDDEATEPPGSFAVSLCRGVVSHQTEIDKKIVEAASKWRIERMDVIDRTVLRLATYELAYTNTPASIVINEAVELAKQFGGAESARFINGVLHRVKELIAH